MNKAQQLDELTAFARFLADRCEFANPKNVDAEVELRRAKVYLENAMIHLRNAAGWEGTEE